MKKHILLVLLTTLILPACNTMQGIGQDVEAAGQWTSDTAQKTQQKMK